MKKTTREWLYKADEDWRAAEKLAAGKDRLHDLVVFHCQQFVEKILKAVLEELGRVIPKTHDLEILLDLILPDVAKLATHRTRLRKLSEFAVTTRYPGVRASKRDATTSIRWATTINTICRPILTKRAPRHRKSP